VFSLKGFWRRVSSLFAPPKACRCDKCGAISRIRICPHCHRAIPFGAGEIDEHVIPIVGATGAGKSSYLTVLIELALKGWVGQDFNFTIAPAEPDTEKLFRTEYADPLITQKQEIPPNHLEEVVNPLIFQLNFHKKAPVTRRMINKTVNIIFYDIAGDLLNPEKVGLTKATECLFHSSGIIYLVNPLHIREIAQLITTERIVVPVITPDIMLSFIKKGIQERMGFRPDDKIPIPFAVCLSMSDYLRDNNDKLGFNEILFQPHRHIGAFDVRDFEVIDAEIHDKLHQWGGVAGHLRRVAEAFFKTTGFFAVSALGASPICGHLEEINPIRVEDPFLWILSGLGIIPKTKG
jgi:hypothetical protein